VIATVRPIHKQKRKPEEEVVAVVDPEPRRVAVPSRQHKPPLAPPAKARPGTTLDGSWDRNLARGLVQPDLVVDLHGHNLANAYSLLDDSLARAGANGARLLLLVTGKPPQGEPPAVRGKIRAAVGDWLAASPHAANIAAVRNAHPRHGGAGALYIILRRRR
jgi:DNA-nicking Smr family endonuclease